MNDTRPKYSHRYYEFQPDCYEGLYRNSNGYAVAIVACVSADNTWAAYIGGADPQSEQSALRFVRECGSKLSEEDARHFFPAIDLDLPYRD